MSTELSHIAHDQIDEAALQQFCNSFSVSHVKIEYCLDLTVPQVTFSVYVLGVRIGGGTLNPSQPCVKVGGAVSGFKAEAELCLEIDNHKITYDIELCAPIAGCKPYKGTLFSW